ncbi:MAG: diguanylate cyclase, partial [Colwellia sp.]
MLKTKLSLHHILCFIIVFTTIIIMGLYTVHSYTTVKAETIKQLEHDAMLSLVTLESNVSNLISAYAVSEYQQLLQTETVRLDSNIAIIVEDFKMAEILNQKAFYVGVIRDSNWDVTDYNIKNVEQNKQLKESYYNHEYNITGAKGENLGIIRIYISNNALTLKLNNIVKDSISRIFIVMLTQLIIFFFTIEYFIKKPLSNIIEVISNTDTDGVPLKRTFEYSSQEISTLASSMNAMLDEIKSARTKLTLKNKELQLSSSVFNDTHGGIMITDANTLIVDVNPSFCDITGYSREDVIGKSPKILSSGKQSPEFYQNMWQQIDEQDHWQGDLWNHKKNGELYATLLTISALKNEDNKIATYVGIFTDITDSKNQKEQLNLMAHYDILTGLPNRALFTDRFTQAIAHANRTETQLAVCFLDLDNFKPVNDNYGHQVGDQLLIEVAKRITANLREEDTVSRQGGDEFALLLNNIECFSQCEQ